MKYTFKWEDKEIVLKPYTINNAAAIEKINSELNSKDNTVVTKIKYIFAGVDLLCANLTAEVLFGSQEELDVNSVFIFFEMLQDAYKKPLNDFRAKKLKQTISDSGITQLRPTLTSISSIAKLTQQQ